MSLPVPSILRPWSWPLASFASTGKLQRNPATGKVQRDSATGKMLRSDAANNTCCCGGRACAFCNIQSVVLSVSGGQFSTSTVEFPLGFAGNYCIPFTRLVGPNNDRCQFGGFCPINVTGGQSGRHYKALSIGVVLAMSFGKLLIPQFTNIGVSVYDDFNVQYGAALGVVNPSVAAANPGCDQTVFWNGNGFTASVAPNNACTGSPYCTGPYCIKDTINLCFP